MGSQGSWKGHQTSLCACVCGSSSWGSSGAPAPTRSAGGRAEEGGREAAAGSWPWANSEPLLGGAVEGLCLRISLSPFLSFSVFLCLSLCPCLSLSFYFSLSVSVSLFIDFLSAFVSLYHSLGLCLSLPLSLRRVLVGTLSGPQVLSTGTWWDHRLVICALGGGARGAYKGETILKALL